MQTKYHPPFPSAVIGRNAPVREQDRPDMVYPSEKQEITMLKFLGGAVGIIFIIGLLVVIGILSLIF